MFKKSEANAIKKASVKATAEKGGGGEEREMDVVVSSVIVPDEQSLPFAGDEDEVNQDYLEVKPFVNRIISEINCLEYIQSVRYKAFPKSDLRIYIYEDLDLKVFPKRVPVFNLNTGKQETAKGCGVPPENFTYRTNRWVFRDTDICLCPHNAPQIKYLDGDYALAFMGVKDGGKALCMIIEFYDLITTTDEKFVPKYLIGHCTNPETTSYAVEIGKQLNATTFVSWAEQQQCMKLAPPGSTN